MNAIGITALVVVFVSFPCIFVLGMVAIGLRTKFINDKEPRWQPLSKVIVAFIVLIFIAAKAADMGVEKGGWNEAIAQRAKIASDKEAARQAKKDVDGRVKPGHDE